MTVKEFFEIVVESEIERRGLNSILNGMGCSVCPFVEECDRREEENLTCEEIIKSYLTDTQNYKL